MADPHHYFDYRGSREVEHAAQYCLTQCECGAISLSFLDAEGNTFAAGVIDGQYILDWLAKNMDAIGQAQGVA